MKTKNLILTLLMMICINCITFAQITFQKTYGGTDWSTSVQQTTDSGYIITGSTYSYDINGDVYLVKIDFKGDTLWTKTYGGTSYDEGYSVRETADGGYIIAGTTPSFGAGSHDVYLIKTNTVGDVLWTKTYGGVYYDWGYSVQQTTDGGYIVAGWTSSFGVGPADIYLIKTDATGDTLWTKTYGGTYNDIGHSVQETADGGYVIAGTTSSFGADSVDVYLIKTDTSGDIVWAKTFGGVNSDGGSFVQQTYDGGYIITGNTKSFGAGASDVYLIKTNTIGDTQWTKTFGGTSDDYGYSVQQTVDKGYIITGYTQSYGAGGSDVYLIKTDSIGDTLWTKTFGGINADCGRSVQQTNDGGYIIVGYSVSFGAGSNAVYLIKTDANGNSGCNQGNTATIVGTPATIVTSPTTLVTSPATIVGNHATMIGSGGIVTSLCITVNINEIEEENSINIFPNPATDNLTIETPQKATIEIINIQGQIIKTLQATEDKTSVDVSDLPGGVYIIKLNTAEGSVVRKFVKE